MVKRLGPKHPKYSPTDEHYTPPEIFEALGLTFDLDVCAPKGGVPWIPAARHYSIDDDALTQPWTGRVWCNPPYSNAGPFVKKWVEHGNGILAVQVAKSYWFVDLWKSQAAIAFPNTARIKWIRNGNKTDVFMPVILAALGTENIEAISRIGRVR